MPQSRWLTSLTIDGLTVGRRLALAATISEAVRERLGTLTVAAHPSRSTLLKIITLFARHGDAAGLPASHPSGYRPGFLRAMSAARFLRCYA